MTTVAEPTTVEIVPEKSGLLQRPPKAAPGLWGWLTTVDHKKIGLLYLGTAFAFFVIGGVEALMVGLQILRTASPPGAIRLSVTISCILAPAIGLLRRPVYVWMRLVARFLLLFALPAITVALFLRMFHGRSGAKLFRIQARADPRL